MNLAELGILVETHSGHMRFLKPVLEHVKKLKPAVLVCAYNTVLDSTKNYSMKDVMPPYDVMAIPDMWMISDFGQRVNAWLWLEKFGLALLAKGFKDTPPPKYVFNLEGDCIITNYKAIHDLENHLISEDADIVCAEYMPGEYAGAVSYFANLEKVIPVIDYMVQEAYKPLFEDGSSYGNAEGRFGKSIKKFNLKVASVRNPEHSQFSFGDRGTWGQILGFRHLHGMEKWRQSHHHPPLPREWYDTRFLGNEITVLEEYWRNGDTKILETSGYWPIVSQEVLEEGKKYLETP
jgi:hypothetical protein